MQISRDVTPFSDWPPNLPGVSAAERNTVILVDGSSLDISHYSVEQLTQLQCEQEPAFARAIEAAPKDSELRRQITNRAYTTICAVLERMERRELAATDFSMGMDERYTDLILRLLLQQSKKGRCGGLFEVGFSSGVLLDCVARQGFPVGGIEVVADLLQQAKAKLEPDHHDRLLLGDFRQLDLSEHAGRYSVVYWNDVLEHIPTDEILDYLRLIHRLLDTGGLLVTITPNWHMRPSDVTMEFSPPRTEAVGFHLKEYRLSEVCDLTLQAGFRHVRTPAYISRQRIYDVPLMSWSRTKVWLEPLLEWMPYPVAVQACRRFGFNCTIASK